MHDAGADREERKSLALGELQLQALLQQTLAAEGAEHEVRALNL
jgi:hypothetical protein